MGTHDHEIGNMLPSRRMSHSSACGVLGKAKRRGVQGLQFFRDEQQAYTNCSVAVDLKISEMVDVPNFVVTAVLPLDIFI